MLTRDQVFAIADKYGAFEFGDAQGHKRQEFAADLIAAHQRIRDAAPDLLAALQEAVRSEIKGRTLLAKCEAAIAKATGAAA